MIVIPIVKKRCRIGGKDRAPGERLAPARLDGRIIRMANAGDIDIEFCDKDKRAKLFEMPEMYLYTGEGETALTPVGRVQRCVPFAPAPREERTWLERSPEFSAVPGESIYIGSNATIKDFDLDITPHLPRAPRVLFIRDNGAGDVILSVPAVRELKRRLPEAHITYATKTSLMNLLDGVGCIDEVVSIHGLDLADGDSAGSNNVGAPYSLIVNWARAVEDYSLPRNRRHRIDSFALQAGLGALRDKRTELHLSEADRRFARGFLTGRGEGFIGYVLRAAAWNRTWPLWRAPRLCEELAKALPNHKVVLIDAQADAGFEGPGIINACGRTRTFRQAAALLELCDATITQDTGLAHACGALGAPALALAGSIPPDVRFSTYKNFRCIHPAARAECCPCWDWQEFFTSGPLKGRRKSCHGAASNPCLESISAWEIAKETAKLIRETST